VQKTRIFTGKLEREFSTWSILRPINSKELGKPVLREAVNDFTGKTCKELGKIQRKTIKVSTVGVPSAIHRKRIIHCCT